MSIDTVGDGASRLHISALSKRFGSNQALDDVSLRVLPGEIRGLVGTNGSGKSTLIKVLSGVYRPDNGATITVDGAPLHTPVAPEQMQALGLSFVHQDLGLVDSLSVADNVRIGRYRAIRGTRAIHTKTERAATTATLERLGCSISPQRSVGSLTPGERAIVAVARALQGQERGRGCIVFDESTQVLPPEAVAPFLAMLRGLARQGTSVLLVSHRLDEVLAVTDHITVLRDGRVAGELTTAGSTESDVALLMLGVTPSRDHLQSVVPTQAGATMLRCENVSGRLCREVSFTGAAGEVIGVTGSTGSGYEELPYLLAGAVSSATGQVYVDGRKVELGSASPQSVVRAGVGLVPKDRAEHGLALGLPVRDNLTLPRIGQRSGRLRLRLGWQDQEFTQAADNLGITPRDPALPVAHLSGGNQQKVLLAKWLLSKPSVLIVHAPTQAVDVGARRDILAALRRAAADGACVLISASETEDLAAACDRVLVLQRGRVVTELNGRLNAEDIRAAASGAAGVGATAASQPAESVLPGVAP